MATGRTVQRHSRFYMNGYDLSGHSVNVGDLTCEFDEAAFTCLTDAVVGRLPNQASLGIKEYRGVMDNTALTGLHTLFNSAGASRKYLYAIGIRGEPAIGDPVYVGQQYQLSYQVVEEGGGVFVTVKFGEWDASGLINYTKPWGNLLLENSAVTGANSTEYFDGGAATAKGGYMAYQVFAASGAGHTATIKVQDSATTDDGDFGDLSGCTTGEIDVGTAPLSGIVCTTAVTTTVKRYLRWQVALGTATSVTLALAFVRG